MNTLFSINRFGYYTLRKILFSKSQYLYIIGIVTATYILSLLAFLLFGFTLSAVTKAVVLISIIIGPCLFETTLTKYNGITEYTFPVSTLERFLYIWLRYIILIPLLTLGLYSLLNGIATILPVDKLADFSSRMDFPISYTKLHILLGIQSVYLAGRLSFQKNAFGKTTMIGLGIAIGCMIFGVTLIRYIFTSFIADNFGSPEVPLNINLDFNYDKFSTIQTLMKYFISFLFPVGLWIVSFFKIREKEI